jgi:hypothetical protein
MTEPTQPANGLTRTAFVLGAFGLLAFPVFLGLAGAVVAAFGMGKGEPRAGLALVFCLGMAVLGVFLQGFMAGLRGG